MNRSAMQIGPNRWAARLYNSDGVCVYNNPTLGSEIAALADATDEIERREAAMIEARAIRRLELAQSRALPLLVKLVHARGLEVDNILAEARALLDGVSFAQAAE